MKEKIHKIGRFYSGIIMGNMGLFIFAGFLSVLFQEQGWFPNEEIYGISQLVYNTIIPICISYSGGERLGGKNGGILAVLTAAGMLYGNGASPVLAGMTAAPLGGFIWKICEKIIQNYAGFRIQMLAKNIMTGVLGGILAIGGYYGISVLTSLAGAAISAGMKFFWTHKLWEGICLFIEPLKVFFLNNVVNHGVLVPLGMEQLQEYGSSFLFLLETNPGPGFGMLAALYFVKKKEKGTYASAMAAQFVGGIHEVYFPIVLSNLWLLVPLVLSSVLAGIWFDAVGAGVSGPVSPGSIVTILLMAGKSRFLRVAAGILISAAASFGISFILLKWKDNMQEKPSQIQIKKEERKMPVHKIGFICDAGVGSSAMGAALLRRKAAKAQVTDLEVAAYACDQIPDTLDMIVCQKDFRKMIPKEADAMEIYTVESLLDQAALDSLLEYITGRNG